MSIANIDFFILGIDIALVAIIYLLEKRNKIGWTLSAIGLSLLLSLTLVMSAHYLSYANYLLYRKQIRLYFNVNFNFFVATTSICFIIFLLAWMAA